MHIGILAHELPNLAKVRNFASVWSYNLAREFRARGVFVSFHPPADECVDSLTGKGVDHVIGLGPYLGKADPYTLGAIRAAIGGLLTQVRDGPRPRDKVDLTFCIHQRGDIPSKMDFQNTRQIPIGWAADPDLFRPAQSGTLTVLIDHPNYGDLSFREDHSAAILKSVALLVSQRPDVEVRRIVDGGVETLDPLRAVVPTFNRKHVSIETMAQEYGRAHVFLVTHPESVGLTVLETAMAGALPVVPRRFVSEELLRTVRHVSYSGWVPWDDVLAQIDVAASRSKAMDNSWQSVVDRLSKELTKRQRQ